MLLALALACADPGPRTLVRATLADGQVLAGYVSTETLHLKGGLGDLAVPMADTGEIVPVEGSALGDAHGYVHVWLRNGTELVGQWAAPELSMEIPIGGEDVPVELPVDHLTRFQTPNAEVWPATDVYRLRTTHGDDLLVDATRTRFEVKNALGTFHPTLAECDVVRPVATPDGDWRFELATGTVLTGRLTTAALTVALPMGPATVSVPIDTFTSLTREQWAPEQSAPSAAPAARAPDGRNWFDNNSLQRAKGSASARKQELVR